MSKTPAKRSRPELCKVESQCQAIKALASDLVPVLKYDIDELLSKAHSKDLIADGLHRQSLGPTPESPSQKTRAFLDAIISRMKLHPPTYDSFMGIVRSFRAFEDIAKKIEEEVNILSSSKKPRKIEHEFECSAASTTCKENIPYLSPKLENCRKKESTFYLELETQHRKPLEDLTNCLNERVAQLKACHEREQKLEMENASLKKSLCQSESENANLKESLSRTEHEKEELQVALDEAEETLSDALSGIKKSRPSKSRVSPIKPDRHQRKLSSENGLLSISKERPSY